MTPYEQWISFSTIVRKDVVRMLRIWPQTFLPSLVTAALYFLIFGAFIGSRIGSVEGVPYIVFIVPGLVMMQAVMNAYTNVAFVMFQSKFFNRNIDEILVSPTPPWVLISGFVAGGVLRGMTTALLVLLVALAFTPLTIANGFVIALFLVLATVIFALGGLANGVFASSIDGINIVPTFVLTPLVYLGGVFYSAKTLPGIWGKITMIDPIFYLVNGFRYGFIGKSDISLGLSISVLCGLAAVLFATAFYLLRTGLGLRQ